MNLNNSICLLSFLADEEMEALEKFEEAVFIYNLSSQIR